MLGETKGQKKEGGKVIGVKRTEVEEEERRFYFQEAEGRRRSGGLAIKSYSFQRVNMKSSVSVTQNTTLVISEDADGRTRTTSDGAGSEKERRESRSSGDGPNATCVSCGHRKDPLTAALLRHSP